MARSDLWIDSSLVAQRLKHLPPMRETWVQSLGQEDPLEKEMVTHSSILAWRIPWTEKPGRLQSTGSQRVRMTERLHITSHHIKKIRNLVKTLAGRKQKGMFSFSHRPRFTKLRLCLNPGSNQGREPE